MTTAILYVAENINLPIGPLKLNILDNLMKNKLEAM